MRVWKILDSDPFLHSTIVVGRLSMSQAWASEWVYNYDKFRHGALAAFLVTNPVILRPF